MIAYWFSFVAIDLFSDFSIALYHQFAHSQLTHCIDMVANFFYLPYNDFTHNMYIYDFQSAMRTVCMREGVNIDGSSLDNVIEASNHDIRQVRDIYNMLIDLIIVGISAKNICSVVFW